MLRRAICSSDGQSRSLIHGTVTRYLRQYSSLDSKPASEKSPKPPAWSPKRNASTRNDGTHDEQRTVEARGDDQGDVIQQPSNAEKHPITNVEDAANERAFKIIRTSALRRRFTYPKEEAESIAHEPLETIETNEYGNSHFSPIQEGLKEGMQSVTNSLSDLIEQMKAQALRESTQEADTEASRAPIEEAKLPLSPLEGRLDWKRRETKPQPTPEEEVKLSYNPWAMMLAAPIRLDTAAKVRYPESLLLTLGEVAHPSGEDVYMLPDDLANLEGFDWRLQRALRRNAWRDPLRTHGGSQIRVLPSQTLLEELTEELMVWDNKTKSLRTKHGIIAKRLLPPRWLERTQQINAYQAASTEYWKIKQQQQQDQAENPTFEKQEKPVDLLALQWQPNIAERILWIMRQRLVLSLDHLGRKVNRSNLRYKPFNFVQCFKWPDSLHLDLTTESGRDHHFVLAVYESPKHSDADSDETPQHPETQLEAPGVKPFAKAAGAPGTEQTYRHNDPDFWLPGSYFLHIGPPETTLTALSSLQGQGHEISLSKLNTPMLTAADVRLPVFNLRALLGPKFDHPLQQILTTRNMTLASEHSIDDLDKQNYLIHIRATAPNSHLLLKELWQLWRYVGGTDCLQPQPHPQATTESQAQSAMEILEEAAKKMDVRKEKDRIKQFKMARKSWDNLYSFLPGIERDPEAGSPDKRGLRNNEEEVKH